MIENIFAAENISDILIDKIQGIIDTFVETEQVKMAIKQAIGREATLDEAKIIMAQSFIVASSRTLCDYYGLCKASVKLIDERVAKIGLHATNLGTTEQFYREMKKRK